METLAEKVLFDTVFGRIESSARNLVCSNRPATGLGLECADCETKGLSVCESLDADEFELLERIGRTLSFGAKATLFEQGRDAPFVSNITSGALRLSKLLPDGRRQVVGFALPGDFLGLAMQPTHMFTADALTPVKICQFSRQGFSDLLDKKPRLMRAA